jgi:maleylpyruvate isomerase
VELHTYFRSTAAYRVRVALNLKQLDADYHYVHLVRDGGEQHKAAYRQVNPQGRVPTLVVGGMPLTQSLAIIEYLEEAHPNPPLLPTDLQDRAWIRSIANLVACDIHPLNNLSVLQYLQNELGIDEAAKLKWYRHWVAEGFSALEEMLTKDARVGDFCYGGKVTLADIFIAAQVYNADRFECDMTPYPVIREINANCLKLDAFRRAAPDAQRDAE